MQYCTILVDNNRGQHRFLKTEHGFSLFLNYDGKKILFDFGSTDVLTHNAKTLDIDLSEVDYLVSSHSHYDHINGLLEAAPLLHGKILYTGKNFNLKKYGRVKNNSNEIEYLGYNLDKDFFKREEIKSLKVEDKLSITEHIHLVSNFTCEKNCDTSFRRFAIMEDGKLRDDYFEDEVAMVIERETDLILIVGCSHPGIINIINKVNSSFDGKKVSSVIGGTHLSKETDASINATANSLINLNVRNYYFCHCSGKAICERLKLKKQNSYYTAVGTTIIL
ncbi:MAG: MBL fold metallo-hydrolase [Sphaerochaeta sp.]